MHLKSDLIRGGGLSRGEQFSSILLSVHLKSGVIRGVVSLEGSSLVVFYYLIASEIWRDKRGGLSRGEQFSSILLSVHLKSGLIRGLVFLEGSSLVVFCYQCI